MSRIQQILEKAEREGTVHRMRSPGESPEPLPAGAALLLPLATMPAAPVRPAEPPGRTVRGVTLHPRLIAGAAGAAGEQYRALRTRIFHGEGGVFSVLLVTSPGRGDGKSLTVANLGVTMAQEFSRRIVVVDANFRDPQQHSLFGLGETVGLSDVLVGGASLDEALVTIEDLQLTVLPAGSAPAHPAELLGTSTMRRTLEALRSRFDCVLIDAPAAAPLADVGVLTPLVDRVILIVRAGVTARPAIHDAISALDTGRLLGIVLNDATAA
jgi:capsular exopolysaccharide synthesis family protein